MPKEIKKGKPLGTDLPIEIVDQFGEWVRERKLVKSDAARVALLLLQRLPLGLYDAVIREQWEAVDAVMSIADQGLARLADARAEDAASHHAKSTEADRAMQPRKRQTRA